MASACTPLLKKINETEMHSPEHSVPLLESFPPRAFSSSPNRGDVLSPYLQLTKRLSLTLRGRLFPDRATKDVGFMHAENVGMLEKRGLYIWGSVGIGKTMVLDLFHLCETKLVKRRAHLHSFMTDVAERLVRAEARLRVLKQAARTETELRHWKSIRPIDVVVSDVLAESPVLCFDEFQTFDVAHGALLAAFFTAAFEKGLYLMTTSNRAPEDLCLVSSAFTSFLPILNNYCHVMHCDAIRDYRIRPAAELQHERVFLYPSNKTAAKRLVRRVEGAMLPGTATPVWAKDGALSHHGRSLIVPYQCGGVAIFDFADICGKNQDLASSDYQLIARSFHTLIITNVPQIGTADRNTAHQFIVLLDEMYQHNVKLLLTLKVPWDHLMETKNYFTGVEALESSDAYYSEGEDDRSGYTASYDFKTEEEIVSFSRIRSRLHEMGSETYLLRDHTHFVVCDFNFSALFQIVKRNNFV
ncbi:hypothetical protein STCU_00203 [Strigomonas culicis]|uniref:ATPase n=1 Tax=Strigomonas culicis TaxID=28005 RepID=S9V7T8_9TRYP|nr:hypothetical protein STCU_00203 [Strigomonas culicis]|eukprot:EPY37094.1 hypothetical protein STCU_00203 [Strigomonas culicis]